MLNPRGGGAHNQDVKLIKKITNEDLAIVMTAVLSQSQSDYELLRAAPGNKFKEMLVSVIDKIIEKGDMQAMNALLDRTCGKVKENIHVTTEAQQLSDAELIKKIDELRGRIGVE